MPISRDDANAWHDFISILDQCQPILHQAQVDSMCFLQPGGATYPHTTGRDQYATLATPSPNPGRYHPIAAMAFAIGLGKRCSKSMMPTHAGVTATRTIVEIPILPTCASQPCPPSLPK
jgi:hypothetical protein